MPIDRILSRDLNLQGYRLRESILDPVPESDLDILASGLTVEDEGYQVFDTTNDQPTYWDGTAWISWPAGGGGTSDVITITYGDLQALTGGSTTNPYYMTDPGKEGFWYWTGAVADQSSDNEGTVIVTADLQEYRRSYDGTLDIRWFGGVSDFVYVNPNFTGTDNTAALNKMFAAAADNQPMLVPDVGTGWLFLDGMTAITNSKIANLTILGDTYHQFATTTTPFISIDHSGKENKIYHRGRAFGALNIPDVSKANYDNNTGPDWNAMKGILIHVLDSIKSELEVNFADGFSEVIHLEGGSTSLSGVQEVRTKLKWLYRNKYGIRLTVTDGSGFVDKCNFYGGRIMGQYPISYDGNLAGPSKTGVFTANTFFNILIEAADTGITGVGEFRFNSFIGCQLEGGSTTGVFGPDKINLGSAAFGNSFSGNETFNTTWFVDPGEHTTISGTSLFSSNSVIVGAFALGGVSNGRLTVVGTQGISNNTRSQIPANIDHITFLGTSTTSNERRTNEFAHVRLNGIEQAVSYDGKFSNITTGGTTTLVPPSGHVRLAAGASAVTLVLDFTQIFNGSQFYIEQTGTGTVEIQRSDTSAVVLATSAITSTGLWYLRCHNGTFTATKISGAGTTSLTFSAIGSAPNSSGASIAGTVATLQPADASFGGIIANATQDIPGAKTFLADLTVRKTTATTLLVDNTSATETTLTSLNLTNIVGGAFIKVNNNAIAELGRKDSGSTAAYVLANGQTYGSGRQWSMGINPGNNHFILNNQSLAANAISIQSTNNNVRIGTSTTDPGVALQVDGSFRLTGQLFLGTAGADPGGAVNGQGYYNNVTEKARLYQNGAWVDWVGSGGGGDGVNAIDEVGAGDDNAATIDGTTLTLHVATSTQPGLWAVGTQTLSGVKTFTGTHIFRTNSVTSGTAPFKIVEGSALMNVQENGAIERFGENLWFTNAVERRILATSHNVVTFFNKTWQGNPIDKTYISGTGAATLQSIRRNAANTDWEWFTPSTAVTVTASNGLTKSVNDIQLGGTMASNTTILGASRNLVWGTTGSLLNNFDLAAVSFNINAGIKLTKVTVSNTAFSLSASTNYVELANTLTADRLLTFPATASGQIIIIHNKSTNVSFQYSIVGGYRLASNATTATDLPNNTVIQLLGTGTEWIAMNK